MNRSRSTTLLSITLGAILFTGAFVPILSQQAFAQVTAQDRLQLPSWQGQSDTVFRHFTNTGFPGDPAVSCGQLTLANTWAITDAAQDTTNWNLFVFGSPDQDTITPTGSGVTVRAANLVDPLLNKRMLIQFTLCPLPNGTPNPTPPVSISNGICFDPTGDTAFKNGVSNGPFIDPTNPFFPNGLGQVDGSYYYFDTWECMPNPNWEQFDINFPIAEFALVQVVVDTITEGSPSIGGNFEGVNTAALLVAGAQANALWLIPLIAAIGVGIVIARRQFF